jgi:hypothetical protein
MQANFKSWNSYWDFARTVRTKHRYVWPKNVEEFLAGVAITAQNRRLALKKGWITWRAQLGHGWRTEGHGKDEFEVPSAHAPKRMRPLPDRAYDGRANPKGIPCLYLATQKETAISEVRPWIGSYVSVGQFKLLRPTEIVDCSHEKPSNMFYFGEPSPEEAEKAVWSDIDRAFSEPMTRSDDTADYVSTQILAELFKREGFGGIGYKSKFGERGYNIALFDVTAADLINCNLVRIETIKFESKDADNPYFVRKYYQSKSRSKKRTKSKQKSKKK